MNTTGKLLSASPGTQVASEEPKLETRVLKVCHIYHLAIERNYASTLKPLSIGCLLLTVWRASG